MKVFFYLILAAKTGLHYTYIGQVERGKKNLSLKSIEKIAKALDTSLPNLFLFLEKRAPQDKLKKQILDTIADMDTRTLKLILRVVKAIVEK
ncbi:hypothetical protein DRI96_05910 [Candidatus Aerophobetes bacterium]|uniref:HTH cro/C1-type domain-containing protein n=1 Tax=Aerophobetes bacterium TaxID=2030807 RepID=A0A662DC74_UNCAE|nr:MAG: hypothetical protein DRI96_05910 [Candidatus Aerophobetes bacterium]